MRNWYMDIRYPSPEESKMMRTELNGMGMDRERKNEMVFERVVGSTFHTAPRPPPKTITSLDLVMFLRSLPMRSKSIENVLLPILHLVLLTRLRGRVGR